MTDKELLELAAKAAGMNLQWQGEKPHIGNWLSRQFWNPLVSDADALRLAVELKMCVDMIENASGAHVINYKFCSELHNGDPYAATRRAVVRCAAEIGKGMP